jgi:hypothetical protein
MRLFRNPVFAVCSVLSFVVGFAMLGSMIYLPTYLQYVDGNSATLSGVWALPLVLGLLTASIFSGNVVSKTGHYRFFPVVGSLVMAAGLYLLSRMGPGSGVWRESLYMLVLGIGIGLSMQVLTIAVQNTVDYADLGTGTSGVTFFRTLGSSFGTAVFGTIYANALRPNLTQGIGQAARAGGDQATLTPVAENPQAVHALPPEQSAPLAQAYADTLHTVFLWTVPVALLGFVVSLFLKQVKLRDSARASSTDMGEGFAQPSTGDATKVLEFAVARILHEAGPDMARQIVARSDTRLDVAGAWAVMQVDHFTRMVGHAGLGLMAARHRIPPEVLVPVFDRMIEEGYLTGDGRLFTHTAAGRREAATISAAWGSWLNEQLAADGARTDDRRLRAAVDVIAKRLLVEALVQELAPPERAVAAV